MRAFIFLTATVLVSSPAAGQTFVASLPPTTPALYEIANGVGSVELLVTLREESPGVYPHQAFVLSFVNDPERMAPVAIEPAGVIADLDGGSGPTFWLDDVGPDFVSVGSIHDFDPFPGTYVTIEVDAPAVVARVTYSTIPMAVVEHMVGFDEVIVGPTVFADPPFEPAVDLDEETTVPLTVEGGTIQWTPTVINFQRGDVNQDGLVDLGDPTGLLAELFQTPTGLPCVRAADANDDGLVNIADAVYTLHYLFAGGAPIPGPADCGSDPTPDLLPCDGSICD